MAADDVAAALCNVALAAPVNNTIEIAGPQPLRFEDFVRQRLRSVGISASWSPILKLGTSEPGAGPVRVLLAWAGQRGKVFFRGGAEHDPVCGAEPVQGAHDRFPRYRG